MKGLKKILKFILTIILVIVVVIIGIGLRAKWKDAHYYKYSNPAGEIEKKYTAMGDKKVTKKEYPSEDSSIGKFVVWYPEDISKSDHKYPVVLWANGTGSKSNTYTAFMKHLASWGFIVVGNDDENTRTGESLNAGIDLLMTENESELSALYQKVDLDNIGIGGHSQGGCAVYNMAVNQPHADAIKTVYAVSATSSYITAGFKDGWEYDISKVKVPTFMTAGTGSFDAGTATSKDQVNDDEKKITQGICPLWSLEENFSLLPENVDKVYARKTGIDHGNSYLEFDGYMTAWFRYWLAGDEDAGKAFFGNNPEISSNSLYQDVKIHEVK